MLHQALISVELCIRGHALINIFAALYFAGEIIFYYYYFLSFFIYFFPFSKRNKTFMCEKLTVLSD